MTDSLWRKRQEPEQEPVAWMYQCSADSSGPVLMQHKKDWAESGSGLWTETPLYTTPPQRKPLTDEEVSDQQCRRLLYGFMLDFNAVGFEQAGRNLHRSIKEAAHGIKEAA